MALQNAGIVAVHAGAGYHSPEKLKSYKNACQAACRKACTLLENNESSLEAVVSAVMVLEDVPITNAGYGSNLTIDGTVECDASVMDGKTLNFGSVGALPGFSNPVLVAKEVIVQQEKGALSYGRLSPCFLVGNGAAKWAEKHGLVRSSPDSLVSDISRRIFVKNKRKLDRESDSCEIDEKLDTVGAIAIDKFGNVAAAVSSGGISMKQSGRVGQAAVFGCGCWAENSRSPKMPSVAVSTSGSGEHLIKTFLAKECANSLIGDDAAPNMLQEVIKKKFLKSPFLCDIKEKLAGVVALRAESDMNSCDVLWAHTTKSLCYGYMSTKDYKPKAGCSYLEDHQTVGSSVTVEGIVLKLFK